MPRGDGTGPMGTGPMTGRGRQGKVFGRGLQRSMMSGSSQNSDKEDQKAYLIDQKMIFENRLKQIELELSKLSEDSK